MFSIFSYIMSRVTHSEPGLPMIYIDDISCVLRDSVILRCLMHLKMFNAVDEE